MCVYTYTRTLRTQKRRNLILCRRKTQRFFLQLSDTFSAISAAKLAVLHFPLENAAIFQLLGEDDIGP